MSETGYDDYITQIEGYSEELECHLSLTVFLDEITDSFEVIECRADDQSPYADDEDGSYLKGQEIQIWDVNKAAVYTLNFSDKAQSLKGTYEIRHLPQEREVSFTDIHTGMDIAVTFDVDGKPRAVNFRVDSNFIGDVEDGQLPFYREKEKIYMSESFFFARTFSCYSQETKEFLKVSLGVNGVEGRPKFSDYKKGVTLKSLLKKTPNKSVNDNQEPKTPEQKQEEAVANLDAMIQKVKELPALGSRVEIIEQIQAKAHAALALSKIYTAQELDDNDPLLGSVVQDFGHMALLGNPGTLKTVMGEILYEAGKASGKIEGPLKWINGREIVQGFIGQTETKMKEILDEVIAQKGMLVIDEFHALNDTGIGGTGKEFGANAVRMLIGAMETNRDDFTVVLAGYPRQVEEAIKQIDPGLKDRLSSIYMLDDYNADELYEIFDYLMPKRYTISPKAKQVVRQKIEQAIANKDNTFSNGRLVRKLVDSVVETTNMRHARDGLFEDILAASQAGELTEDFIKAARSEARSIIARDVEAVDLMALDKKAHVNSMGFSADIRSKTDKPVRAKVTPTPRKRVSIPKRLANGR